MSFSNLCSPNEKHVTYRRVLARVAQQYGDTTYAAIQQISLVGGSVRYSDTIALGTDIRLFVCRVPILCHALIVYCTALVNYRTLSTAFTPTLIFYAPYGVWILQFVFHILQDCDYCQWQQWAQLNCGLEWLGYASIMHSVIMIIEYINCCCRALFAIVTSAYCFRLGDQAACSILADKPADACDLALCAYMQLICTSDF